MSSGRRQRQYRRPHLAKKKKVSPTSLKRERERDGGTEGQRNGERERESEGARERGREGGRERAREKERARERESHPSWP